MTRPLSVSWHVSYQCNLNCSHCYSRTLPTGNELSPDHRRQAARALLDLGVRMVGFGGGEPLFVRALPELIEALSRDAACSMTSNGQLWNHQWAVDLAAAGLSNVSFSVDFPDEERNALRRGRQGYLQRVIEAIGFAREAGIGVGVTCTIANDTVDTLEGVIDLAESLDLQWVRFNSQKPLGNADRGFMLPPDGWRDVYHRLDRLQDHHRIRLDFGQGAEPLVDVALLESGSPRQVPAADRLDCGSLCGKQTFTLRPDGRMTPCSYVDLTIGNILDADPAASWDASPLRALLNDRQPQGKCGHCRHWTLCRGGCPSNALALTGTITAGDPTCWVAETGADHGD
ncbi:MAG: radical SAM protein [Magnetococcales bacterium]|nr:radical SAM protein [Magnetococcales bacterium]